MTQPAGALAAHPESQGTPAPDADPIELSRLDASGARASPSTEPEPGRVSASAPGPVSAQGPAERWNQPRVNIGRLAFAYYSFIIAGMNEAAVGLEHHYKGRSNVDVSWFFLTPAVGYLAAALANAPIHRQLGHRGVAVGGPFFHLATFACFAYKGAQLPAPAVIAINALSGFGNGLTEACFNAWVAGMDKAGIVQGLMYSCYSLGAFFSSLAVAFMVVEVDKAWLNYYYVVSGMALIELFGLTVVFWNKDGPGYRAEHAHEGGTRKALRSVVTWLCALFLFVCMAAEAGLGGWVVTFRLDVSSASPLAPAIANSSMWATMALGRALFGVATRGFEGRRRLTICLATCLAICVGFELLF
ncbi:major facilitator superfamily transporter [Hirsutella rhossiliensis]|uniref:Major facilitator superfamily transporter n=1 Tax=Hirsutella rhossiliensis TaxID=111463 RepID=A0A9P8MQ59_9HYPO|nr:major facilitator superfamily transporter [Hirsutella rhossiliensis]KAH0960238.1 major facilitator superfamily transporter [Hirsutella rhossiliensis]